MEVASHHLPLVTKTFEFVNISNPCGLWSFSFSPLACGKKFICLLSLDLLCRGNVILLYALCAYMICSLVQFSHSVVPDSATPWIAARQASLSITSSRSALRLTLIQSVMPSNHHPLSSPSPSAPNPSQHQSLFQWVNSSHEVAKVLEFQL